MTDAIDFERQLDDWFAGEAPGRAPDRLLANAMERVGTIGQRRSIRSRLRSGSRQATWQRGLAVALIVLATVLAALLVAGALQRDPTPPLPSPDLVVLRDGRIVAIAMDGTERELGRLTDEQVGGRVSSLINAGVSPDGHLMIDRIKDDGTAGLIVFDLRDLDAPPTEPDVEGHSHGFSPDGTIGMVTADGIATFDPISGVSRSTPLAFEDGNPVLRPLTPGGGVQWAADGSGILAETGHFTIDTEGTVTTAMIGRLGADGSFAPGAFPVFDDGIMGRRIGPAGEVLRCRREADDTCDFESGQLWAVTDVAATPVWTNPDPSTRIVDFSWAVDGGLWVLRESAAEGPRTVSLIHVSPSDDVRTITSFAAEADDPDPNSYIASAVFLAVAPDDSRLVVFVNETNERRVPYLIDPAGGSPTRIDREIAGWLPQGAIEAPRPEITPSPSFDASVRGLWTDGRTTVDVAGTSLTTRGFSLKVEASDGEEVTLSGSLRGAPCDPNVTGTYRMGVVDGRLTIAALADPCEARAEALTGRYDTSIPIEESGPPIVPAGIGLRSAALGLPIALRMPASGGAQVERHFATDLTMVGPIRPEGTSEAEPAIVSVYVPTTGLADPCVGQFSDLVPLDRTVEGIVAYIDGLAESGISRTEATNTTFAGLPGVTFDVTVADVGCGGGVLFRSGPGAAFGSIGSPARLTVLQHPDGPVIVIVVGRFGATDPVSAAWADELAASISFEPLE